MEKETVQFKKTLRGSVGAGVSALFNGGGRKYYILTHKDATKFHKAGESQKIIIDEIEIGRDSKCQVRFDESMETVSRHHAAIVKDGEKWKLVQLSKTNSTLLNGQKVEKEWYLKNGDEIQIAINGPRIGFIVPEGKQSLVSSIKMTERLELFRKQALRPYKQAITTMAVILVLAIGGLTTWNILQKQDFDSKIAEAKSSLASLIGKNEELDSLLAAAKKEDLRQDSLLEVYKKQIGKGNTIKVVYPNNELSDLLKNVENDIFYIRAKVVISKEGETIEIPQYGWGGTGFLTTDGKFITAKHCVEGWKYTLPSDSTALYYLLAGLNTPGCKIKSVITATSKNKTLHFTSDQFTMDHTGEKKVYINSEIYYIKYGTNYTDWACVNTSDKGSIVVDKELASNLPIGADLHLLGFPLGMGAIDTYSISPLYGSCKTSKAGLEDGIIRISARNYESGNSGGPVFYNEKGKLKAVGIVSYSVSTTTHGGLTSISNVQ